MSSLELSWKRIANEEISGTKKRCKIEADSITDEKSESKDHFECTASLGQNSLPSLQMIREMQGEFECKDGMINGVCVLCTKELSLSWSKWSQHLLDHTSESRFYCTKCEIGFATNEKPHGCCSLESMIDVYGDLNIGDALEGFICKLCNYLQINDYRLLKHIEKEHSDVCASFEYDVERVLLIPNVRPEDHKIQIGFGFVAANERYRCGVGNCIFHGKSSSEYIEHFQKAHSIVKRFFCPHCKKMIDRMRKPTVSIESIMDHIDLHGRYLHQCDICLHVNTSETELRIHLSNDHSDAPIKFWRNRRHMNGVEKYDFIEIVLDCSLCHEHVINTAAAHEHFKSIHPECDIHFKVITKIKTTTNELNVIYSIDDDDDLRYCEVMTCGRCTESFLDKHDWFEHFIDIHPTDQLVAKRDFKWIKTTRNPKMDRFDKGMLFYCAFCGDSNNMKLECHTTVEGVYDHWKRIHLLSDAKPFQFRISELVACSYCEILSPFHVLQQHVANEHSNKPFIPLKAFEFQRMCGLCGSHEGNDDDLIKHVENEHALAMQSNVLNPIQINDMKLWKLIRICVHKKVKCDYCDNVFETKDDFYAHHSNEHHNLERMYRRFYDTESIKLIGDCCHLQVDPNVFFDHLAFHKYSLNCVKCQFQTTDSYKSICHQVKCQSLNDTVESLYRKFMELRYWRSEFIFGNGLVLNKFNTQRTQFDYSTKFNKYIERLIDDKSNRWEHL